jgi:translation initiation factor IF-3
MSKEKVRINQQIRSPELRVIDDEGGNLGVIPLAEAIKRAMEKGLDLIEISPNAVPPVAKIPVHYPKERKGGKAEGAHYGNEDDTGQDRHRRT